MLAFYVPYYFEYKTHILHSFSRWKIEVRHKFEESAPFWFFPPKIHIQKRDASEIQGASYIQSNTVLSFQ